MMVVEWAVSEQCTVQPLICCIVPHRQEPLRLSEADIAVAIEVVLGAAAAHGGGTACLTGGAPKPPQQGGGGRKAAEAVAGVNGSDIDTNDQVGRVRLINSR